LLNTQKSLRKTEETCCQIYLANDIRTWSFPSLSTIPTAAQIIYYGNLILYKGLRMASVTVMVETMEADDGDRKNANSSS